MGFGILAGVLGGGLLGLGASSSMGDSAVGNVPIPEFQEPEYYTDIQDLLYSFGSDVLKGDIPEFYKPLTEFGSREFEDYLSNVIGDIEGGVYESAARLNQRGGAVGENIAKAVGDVSTKMRYEDLLRGLQGRGNMLTTGLNTLSGVRGSDLSYTDLVNQFSLNRTNLLLGQAQAEDAWKQSRIGNITSGIMGGASLGTSIWGYNQLSDAMRTAPISSGMGSALGMSGANLDPGWDYSQLYR